MRFFIKKYAKIAENECVLRTFGLYIYSPRFFCSNQKSARFFIFNGCFCGRFMPFLTQKRHFRLEILVFFSFNHLDFCL